MQIERYEIPQKTYRISLAAFFTSFLDLKSIFAISALLHGKKFRSVLKSDVYDKKNPEMDLTLLYMHYLLLTNQRAHL